MKSQRAMVQILIQLSDNLEEWGLVELQGQLETRDEIAFDNMHIGDLHFDSKGTPNLIVGHHLLTGKVVELEKPFAVLKKTQTSGKPAPHSSVQDSDEELESDTITGSMECGPRGPHSDGGTSQYEVTALITKKIIFKNRPKPIITKTLPRKVR